MYYKFLILYLCQDCHITFGHEQTSSQLGNAVRCPFCKSIHTDEIKSILTTELKDKPNA